jgi:hypothetical protein
MPIDAHRLDEVIAEFSRQRESLRARLSAVTVRAEIMGAVLAEFSTPSPDAAQVRVFLMQGNSPGTLAQPAPGLPPWLALTDEEAEVVQARRPEIEAIFRDCQQIVEEAAQRLPKGPAAPTKGTIIKPEDPEARMWLRANPSDAPLAANRFDADDAREFVESLYRAGAANVVIASECMHDEEPPYADGLRVMLPDDRAARTAVLDLVNRELEEEGFATESDHGQQVVFLWWD